MILTNNHLSTIDKDAIDIHCVIHTLEKTNSFIVNFIIKN